MTTSVQRMISDERWGLVCAIVPGKRSVLAAVVYVVMTDLRWSALPSSVFGVSSTMARRVFREWTDAEVWQQVAVAAIGTRHARWARTVADAAMHRACRRASGLFGDAPDYVPDDRATPVRRPRYLPQEYALARAALDRHDGSAL